MEDFRGRKIEIGSLIAYPGRMSSSIWLTVARVTGFGTRLNYYGGEAERTLKVHVIGSSSQWKAHERDTTLFALDRVLVIGGPPQGVKE